jgi:ESS family glutamate:Na+ symporter
MTISAWFTIALAVPVLLLGEFLVRRIKVLSRFNIPAPVVGGLLLSLLVLLGNLSNVWPAKFDTKIASQWWTWLVSIEPEWVNSPAKNANLPFLVMFFTCIGLNASWSLVKKGSVQVLIFLALAGQCWPSSKTASASPWPRRWDQSPLLGLVCGSVTMTGGHGTALGLQRISSMPDLKAAGVLGVAAATFGSGGWRIDRRPGWRRIDSPVQTEIHCRGSTHLEAGESSVSGILPDLRALVRVRQIVSPESSAAARLRETRRVGELGDSKDRHHVPGLHGRNVAWSRFAKCLGTGGAKWVKTEIIDTMASVTLGIFLAIAMMSLNLIELASAAVPMLVILAVQVTSWRCSRGSSRSA